MTLQYQSIAVKHNMEIAHRLYLQPGKCQQIHGHGMQVTLELVGIVNQEGIFGGIDYSDLKKAFRKYIDETYDHRLLLNLSDPFARPIFPVEKGEQDDHRGFYVVAEHEQIFLPGLQALPGDPTTENLSLWIAKEMQEIIHAHWPEAEVFQIIVTIWETGTNNAKTTLSHDSSEMRRRHSGTPGK